MNATREILFLFAIAAAGPASAAPLANPAAAFGARESVEHISLSPDGQQVAWLQPGPGQVTELRVSSAAGGAKSRLVTSSDGKPFRLERCNWAANDRLVCFASGLTLHAGSRGNMVSLTRLVAIDADGGNPRELGRQVPGQLLRQFDGDVLDWLDQTGSVLMQRPISTDWPAELAVDRVDTRTLKSVSIEKAVRAVDGYVADGGGNVRMRARVTTTPQGLLESEVKYEYRLAGTRDWRKFGTFDRLTREGVAPLSVDGASDSVFVLKQLDGRQALYRVKLDETLASELVYAHPAVDVADVATIGPGRRAIGARYVNEATEIQYFDPAYQALARSLAKALPALPAITFVDASRDEKRILIRASSDQDPGRYYLFDRAAGSLNELLLARPELEGVPLSVVKRVTYSTADGTKVPAYLTLPPGSPGKGLPGIVMPRGPVARDEWGFDWLAQFFAHQGYAVLQPNFRGSTGYGEEWPFENGFESWRTAIGDVNDAGRWLVREGIAADGKLAIAGWSYGGYMALQANVLDPGLFKAVVAVAPVTDLARLMEQSRPFVNFRLVKEYIGSGPHVTEGSPARNAAAFRVPVLLFHGDRDEAVGINQSRRMDAALRAAGKQSELVVYTGLEHDLADSEARADLLRRSETFLAEQLEVGK